MLTLSLPLCQGDDTRQSSTRFNHKNCTAVCSAQEPGFEVPHLVLQGLAPGAKLAAIALSFREHRPGHLAQTSEPPSLRPRTHSLAGLFPSAFTADLQVHQPTPSPHREPRACVRACVYTTSSVSPHSPLYLRQASLLFCCCGCQVCRPSPQLPESLLPQRESRCRWRWVLEQRSSPLHSKCSDPSAISPARPRTF